jgi:uncharacterized protein YraI
VVCKVRVLQNVNFRAAPSITAARLGTIPFDTMLDVVGKSRDGTWWNVSYEGRRGWVSAEFVQADGDCEDAPVVQS